MYAAMIADASVKRPTSGIEIVQPLVAVFSIVCVYARARRVQRAVDCSSTRRLEYHLRGAQVQQEHDERLHDGDAAVSVERNDHEAHVQEEEEERNPRCGERE
jgi:hypothetical protein